MVSPEGERVPLMHYNNLILIDIELDEGEPETATPKPAPLRRPAAARPARPRAMVCPCSEW